MRLVLLADTAAAHTRRWVNWFSDHGYQVLVVSFNSEADPGYDSAVQIVNLWVQSKSVFVSTLLRPIKFLVILYRLRKLLHRFQPDVVHAHSAGGYSWAAWVLRLRPLVITPWGTDILVDVERSRINRFFTKAALSYASIVTTDGKHFVDRLVSLGVESKDIYLHMFGTDVSLFSRKDAVRAASRSRYGYSDSDIVIVSTRTLVPVHDVEVFVKAAPKLAQLNSSFRFLIVGDGSERSMLEAYVDQAGIAHVIHFAGLVNENEMIELLLISDIYVSTSKMDAGLAASTAEAMSMQLPVVQTNNSDNLYWVADGQGGYSFENGDGKSLVEAILALVGDQNANSFGRVNREKIVKENNLETEMLQFSQDVYRAVARKQ